jgi:hypothetical protein
MTGLALSALCPACGIPVDLARRIAICGGCWVDLCRRDVDKAGAVIRAWVDRKGGPAAYRDAVAAAVAALKP